MEVSRKRSHSFKLVEFAVKVEDITTNEVAVLDMGTIGVKLEWIRALRVRCLHFFLQ